MIFTDEVTLRTIIKGDDRPSNHGVSKDTNQDVVCSVNITSLSYEKVLRDFGEQGKKMLVMRTLTELPSFDNVIVSGYNAGTYKKYAGQAINTKNSITLIEV